MPRTGRIRPKRSVSATAPHDIHEEEAVKALQDMLWDVLTAGDPREYTPDQIDELPESVDADDE